MTNTISQLSAFTTISSGVVQPNEDANIIIYDPGLRHTAPFRSEISFINGETGKLWYRDKDIAEVYQLAPLLVLRLLTGRRFEEAMVDYTFSIEEQVCLNTLFEIFPGSVSMTTFSMAVQALESLKRVDAIRCFFRAHKLLFLLLTKDSDQATSLQYHSSHYLEFMTASQDAGLQQVVTNLHAEHGLSCSTNVVRCVASAGGSLLSSILAGIEAFAGPLHGGASQEVSKLVDATLNLNKSVQSVLAEMKKDKKRVPGLGHRVYKTWDPRARIMHAIVNSETQIFRQEEQRTVLELVKYADSEYFKSRGIYPNPDLFNGLLFRRAFSSFDNNLVPLCFSRMIGWLAHYLEEVSSGSPIVRPTHIQL